MLGSFGTTSQGSFSFLNLEVITSSVSFTSSSRFYSCFRKRLIKKIYLVNSLFSVQQVSTFANVDFFFKHLNI